MQLQYLTLVLSIVIGIAIYHYEPKAPDSPFASSSRFEIQKFTRFSQCHLWDLLLSLYERKGLANWEENTVPYFVTSNAFIAKAYVDLIDGYVEDLLVQKQFDSSSPIFLIELGAGAGKLSHLILQTLTTRAQKSLLNFRLEQIKYVMTDFTAANFHSWKEHPAFQTHLERGLLDFAVFDCTKQDKLYLNISHQLLSREAIKNPIIVIANYLFDSLPHDLFQVVNGKLKEGKISVGSTKYEKDLLAPSILERMWNLFSYQEIQLPYYQHHEDPQQAQLLNALLQWYCEYFHNTTGTFLLPIGALRALHQLQTLSGDRVMVLAADKAHDTAASYAGARNPSFASFSVIVNFHALGLYFNSLNGFTLHEGQHDAHLKVSAFVSNANQDNTFRNFRFAFEQSIKQHGPNDFFVNLMAMVKVHEPNFARVVAFLRLAHWDSEMVYQFRKILHEDFPLSRKMQASLLEELPLTWANHFQLDRRVDLAYEIGVLYSRGQQYHHALEYFNRSLQATGNNYATYYNMGLVSVQQAAMEQLHEKKLSLLRIAQSYFQLSEAANPAFPPTLTALKQVLKDIEATAGVV